MFKLVVKRILQNLNPFLLILCMWEHCCVSNQFSAALQFLCFGVWCPNNRRTETVERWKHNKDWGEAIQKGISVHSSYPFYSDRFSLCCCYWEFLPGAGAGKKRASRRQRQTLQWKYRVSALKHRSAQHQQTRPYGQVPSITTTLYYQYSKKFIAPPHFHHCLCRSCFLYFQKGLVEKVSKIFLFQTRYRKAQTQIIPTRYFCLS